MYEERYYRQQMCPEGMAAFRAVEYESDLYIAVSQEQMTSGLKKLVKEEIHRVRKILTDYETLHTGFIESLVPLPILKEDELLIKSMKTAGITVGVGPMAAVAGAVSEQIAQNALKDCSEFILENGGDLLIKTGQKRRVAIETGNSPFKDLHLLIEASKHPIGICTSSGIMGHSLSFGKADAATVISENVYLADAAATALGNRLKTAEDIQPALEWIQRIPGIKGVLVIIEGRLGAWGEVTLD